MGGVGGSEEVTEFCDEETCTVECEVGVSGLESGSG